MQLFKANLVFLRRSCRELYVMKGRRNEKLNGGFRRRLVAQGKLHCLAKLTLYVHICYVCDRLYTSWRVKATLRYRFKTLDRKPRPPKPIRSQSYIGPTVVIFVIDYIRAGE